MRINIVSKYIQMFIKKFIILTVLNQIVFTTSDIGSFNNNALNSSNTINNYGDLEKNVNFEEITISSKVKRTLKYHNVKLNSNPKIRSSLPFVFDRTGSMYKDLERLREGATLILEEMSQREECPISDYVLVPFADPDVGPITVTQNATVFKQQLDEIYLHGGGDCPERSLTAIVEALRRSQPFSFIYVFTDASAADPVIVEQVLDVVQRKQSQIVFVLTGHCNDTEKDSYQVYERIAAASSGQIFNLKKTEVGEVLKFVKDTLEGDRVNLGSIMSPPGYNQTHKVSVDTSLKNVTVSVAGKYPQIVVRDPNGTEPPSETCESCESGPPKLVNLLDLVEIKAISIVEPEAGAWSVAVGAAGPHSVRLAGVSPLRFRAGFSTHQPSAMHHTSHRPLIDKKTISYKSCGQTTSADDYDEAHLKTCLKQKKDIPEYLLYRYWTSSTKGFKCDVCDRTFNKPHLLSAHKKLHQRNNKTSVTTDTAVTGPHKCTECKAQFTESGGLHAHMRTHTGERPYKFTECKAQFTHRSSLHAHMRTHTGERPYKCMECKAQFTQIGSLHAHLRTHTGERPYKCTECKAQFTRSGSLHVHMRTHTGERPYKCTECKAQFTQSERLHAHLRIHTGERPYKCTECKAQFTRSDYLTTHIRTHTGERPYKCTECKVQFTRSYSLHTHMRTHTGERPYQCSDCGAQFTQSSNLHVHMRRCHAK